jgi:hypothetical protein
MAEVAAQEMEMNSSKVANQSGGFKNRIIAANGITGVMEYPSRAI